MNIGNLISMIKRYGGNGGSSTPAPVVILPETETPELNPGSQYSLYTAPENAPIEGVTYKVTWSGGEYDSLAVDASAVWDMPSGSMFLLGNSDMMNLTTQIGSNPAPDAPFLLMLTPIGATEDGVTNYGTIFNDADVIANPTPVISIVEAAKTESAGGGSIYMVTATITDASSETSMRLEFDKTFDEVKAAAMAGQHPICRVELNGEGDWTDFPIVRYNAEMLYFALFVDGMNISINWNPANGGTLDVAT